MTISDERSKPSATVRRTGSVQKCEVNDSSVRRIVFFNAEAARGRIFGGCPKHVKAEIDAGSGCWNRASRGYALSLEEFAMEFAAIGHVKRPPQLQLVL